MNATQAETIRQFLALTPEAIRVGRQTFRRATTLTGDGDVVFFAWASKRKGAIVADKIVATVDYCHASDTYSLGVARFDGVTFAVKSLSFVEGATFEAFRNVGAIVANAVTGGSACR